MFGYHFCGKRDLKEQVSNDHSTLEAQKMGVFVFFAPTPKNHENPHFVVSRALIKNRLDTSSNLAHRGMHAKFQPIWTVRLVRVMGGGVEIDLVL